MRFNVFGLALPRGTFTHSRGVAPLAQGVIAGLGRWMTMNAAESAGLETVRKARAASDIQIN